MRRPRLTLTCVCWLLALTAMTTPAHAVSLTEKRILTRAEANMHRSRQLLEETAALPSSTLNLAGVRKVGSMFAGELGLLGFQTSWVEMPPEMHRAGHLVAVHRGGKGRNILLIGHLDTVLEGSPVVRDGAILRGNGVSDMKGGDVVIVAALRALHEADVLRDLNVTVVLTGDEENPGLPLETSRRDLIEAGKSAGVALAFEGTVDQTATVARRGVSKWELRVTGTGGHSSGIFQPELGAGAVFEVSRILAEIYRELGHEEYLTFNPSVLLGGTDVKFDRDSESGTASGKSNVVPSSAVARGDLRFISNEQRDRAQERMRAIVARHLPKTSAEITFTNDYPAMPPTDGNNEILREFDKVSRDLGFGAIVPLDPAKRGAGDISFVAPFVSGIDGLGAVGEEEHTQNEYVKLEPLEMLVKRAAVLIYRLGKAR